ncbi:MAG TPA: DUF2310 family Zn-ribbon-containing protein [Drouetiella sp.]|jgi:predicted  nucleic acid-binding Zn ribbon protein
MIVAKAEIGSCPDGVTKDQCENLARTYMVALLKNWQILSDYQLAWNDGRLSCFTSLSRRDSFKPEFSSEWGNEALSNLIDAGFSQPVWTVLDNETEEELDGLQGSKALVLFTHFLDKQSPLMSIPVSCPIALYTLLITDSEREDLYSWASQYRSIDKIEMGTHEQQLLEHLHPFTNELFRQGQLLCSCIEQRLGVPTYLFIHLPSEAHSQYNESATLDVCPGCRTPWDMQKLTQTQPLFEYSCTACKLVSAANP